MTFRDQDHRDAVAQREKNAARKSRKKALDRQRKKALWANRTTDAQIAEYLARNPVALYDRVSTEINFGEEE